MIPAEFPSLQLRAADGASAVIAVDGAQVASWIPAGSSDDRLFVSAKAFYGPGASIRGGIPVIFPQFGAFGSLGQHGFARNRRWRIVAQQPDQARLELRDDAETRALWPHAFCAQLQVHVSGDTLTATLQVSNTGDAAFSFTAALHPYFAVRDAFAARVEGLQGCRYRDALQNGAMLDEMAASLEISGPLDRIFYNAPNTLRMIDGDRTLTIEKTGFPEAVVWNPGELGTRSRADFVAGEEHRMLCVEAAVIEHPVLLAPGASWAGTQRMRAG